jgi:hypothetical protein
MGRFRSFWESFLTQILETDRKLQREVAARPRLSEDAFYERFYSGLDIPREVPIRLRRLWADELGDEWYGVEPADNPAHVYWTLDLADLFDAAAEEFGIKIPKEDRHAIDGSFDSLVRYLAKRQQQAASK